MRGFKLLAVGLVALAAIVGAPIAFAGGFGGGYSKSVLTDGNTAPREGVTQNAEPNPKRVRYGAELLEQAASTGDIETAALYMNITPNGEQKVGLYCDLEDQSDTYGACIKIIHSGQGDAIYVPTFSTSGAAVESAAYADGTKGLISTIQYLQGTDELGKVRAHRFDDNTLLSLVWGYDGTGGSVQTPNLGALVVDRSLGNAITVRVQNTAQTMPEDYYCNDAGLLDDGGVDPSCSNVLSPASGGVTSGAAEIKIIDWAQTQLWGAHNDGSMVQNGVAATSGDQYNDSPLMRQRATYWTGSASADIDAYVQHVNFDATGENSAFSFVISDEVIFRAHNAAVNKLDLQGTTYIANVDQANNYVGSHTESFTNGDLSAGVLSVTHSLGTKFVQCTVFDNSDVAVAADSVTGTSTSVADIDLTTQGALTGTWNVRCAK